MSLALSQLVKRRTVTEWTTSLLAALQGVGFVDSAGTGTGSIALSGIATAAYDAIVTLLTSGELGVATFKYQLTDPATGIVTVSGTITVPGGGTYVLPGTGVTITWSAGPAGAGTSFVAGDTYTFTLSTPAFPVTSWQAGSVPRTLTAIMAAALSDVDKLVASIASSGLLTQVASIGRSADAWVALLATEVYGLTPKAAVATRGSVVLSDPNGAGPYTITVGQLWVAESASGKRFNNVAGGTLPKNGTVTLVFQAESPGSAYNVANASITSLLTSLPGVTVNNPDPGSGTWITQSGTDAETNDSVIARCRARWPGLGGGATVDVYKAWAVAADPQVTRAKASPDAAYGGQVDVYIAGSSGPVAGGVVTAVQTYMNPRVPLTAAVVVASAAGLAVTVTATVYVRAAQLVAAQAAAAANLQAYFAALPIGGDIALGPGGIVSREALIKAIMAAPGVLDLAMSAPAADAALTAVQVATLTSNLTWVPV